MFTASNATAIAIEDGVVSLGGEASVVGKSDSFSFSFVDGQWVRSSQVRAWGRAWDRARTNSGHKLPTKLSANGPVVVKAMPKRMRSAMLRASKVKVLAAKYGR